MKKIIYIILLLFIFIQASGCSLTKAKNMAVIDKEKIGVEYTVMESNTCDSYDSHGYVENYSSDFEDNVWTTKFDFMNSTGNMKLEIDPEDILKVNSKFNTGEVWLKITQGDLIESDIQKVEVKSGEEVTADLSQWESGNIEMWLVAKKCKNGLIKIEHVKK